MYLVDEKHVPGLQGCQKSGQVARLVQDWSRGYLYIDSKLAGHDIGERGLSQSRRPVEKNMVERLAPHKGRLYEYLQIGDYLVLSREIYKFAGADNSVQILIFVGPGRVRGNISSHRKNKFIQIYRFIFK